MTGHTPESIKKMIGAEVGVSDWTLISQSMVDAFAELTGDFQFIHTDPEKAKASPFGGPIAHGFLTLSMLGGLGSAANFAMEGVTMGVNCGFEKVRFLAPVRTGARVRARFVLKAMEEKAPGQWLSTLGVTMEIEGEDKPALVADWLGLQFVAQ